MTPRMRAALLTVGTVVLTTWPWPREPTRALGARDLEAGDHLWALWLGSQDGALLAQTERIGAPDAYTWVIGDPIHVPVFALGQALGGAGTGLGLVQILALCLAALAGWAWARHSWPDRPSVAVIAAPLAAASPGLGLGLVTGMTEAQPLGVTALALLTLFRVASAPTHRRVALCALAFGALPWFGPYPAIYAILLAPVALTAGLAAAGTGTRMKRVGGVALAALAAAVLAAPVVQTILSARDPSLPGGTALTAQVLADPDLPLNRMLGADLLGLFLPGMAWSRTGLHPSYLGLTTAAAALLSVAFRRHRRWTPLLLVGAAGMLSLGFTLQAGGAVLRLADTPLLAPAGLLSLAVEGLGRAPRWTRMATLASILMAPIAAAGIDALASRVPGWLGRALLLAGPGILIADMVLVAPSPFPRPTFSPAAPAEFSQMTSDGGVLELPAPRYSTSLPEAGGGPRARLRHPTLVWQTGHGRTLSGNPHQAGRVEGSGAVLGRRFLTAARARDMDALEAARTEALAFGFGWAVAYKGLTSARQRAALVAVWGPPPVDGPALSAWPLGR